MASKIKVDTIKNVAGSGNVSLGSGHNLVVPGDLTVDTSTLKVDATNNRVGIGTTSPSRNLHVKGGIDTRIRTEESGGSLVDLTVTNSGHFIDSTSTGDLTINKIGSANMIFKTTNAERLRIDNSGNVGIGTTSPSRQLHINNASESNIRLQGGSDYAELRVKDADNAFSFHFGASERMRIDASGNVLVGKTSAATNVEGGELRENGQVLAVATNVNPFFGARLGSDGDLAVFRKDSTTVGSIGVINSDRLYIGTPDGSQCAIRFDGDTQDILPSNASGSALDNAISLGDGGTRFKDLYLSGGVYLGGTGSANYLNDYEEGTFTPIIATSGANVAYASHYGTYTKVGRAVHFNFQIHLSTVTSQGSGDFIMGGLPFSQGTNDNFARFVIQTSGVDFNSSYTFFAYPSGGTGLRVLGMADNTGWHVFSVSDFSIATGDIITVTGTFKT